VTAPAAQRPPAVRAAAVAVRLADVSRHVAAGSQGCVLRARLLEDISLHVRAGACVGIVGPPGSGKTQLLLCAAGLARVSGGSVEWSGAARDPAERVYASARALERAQLRVSLICLDDADIFVALPFIAEANARGAAILAAARDPFVLACAGALIRELRGGRLAPAGEAPRARVAEGELR